jgi:hypothetical protein
MTPLDEFYAQTKKRVPTAEETEMMILAIEIEEKTEMKNLDLEIAISDEIIEIESEITEEGTMSAIGDAIVEGTFSDYVVVVELMWFTHVFLLLVLVFRVITYSTLIP